MLLTPLVPWAREGFKKERERKRELGVEAKIAQVGLGEIIMRWMQNVPNADTRVLPDLNANPTSSLTIRGRLTDQ